MKRLDGLRHLILEPILDNCSANQAQALLEVIENLGQNFFRLEVLLSFWAFLQELRDFLLVQESHGNQQCPVSIPRRFFKEKIGLYHVLFLVDKIVLTFI